MPAEYFKVKETGEGSSLKCSGSEGWLWCQILLSGNSHCDFYSELERKEHSRETAITDVITHGCAFSLDLFFLVFCKLTSFLLYINIHLWYLAVNRKLQFRIKE